jgi:aspartate 1-decarboxylase
LTFVFTTQAGLAYEGSLEMKGWKETWALAKAERMKLSNEENGKNVLISV